MEEKNEKKKNGFKKKLIIILLAIVIIPLGILITCSFIPEHKCKEYEGNYEKFFHFQGDNIDLLGLTNDYKIITNYEEFIDLYSKIENFYLCSYDENTNNYSKYEINTEQYNEEFFTNNSLLYVQDYTNKDSELLDVIGNENNVTIKIQTLRYGTTAMSNVCCYFIPISKNVTNVELVNSIENTSSNNSSIFDIFNPVTEDKPIIYLYPAETTNVKVELGKPENITCSYPKYIDGWTVEAKPNGDLTDLDTNKYLYSLYYESLNDVEFNLNTGFVVKGEDSASFLEEKLAILGLNEREAQEFIIYWLPKLEANNYNYIYFASMDEINQNMSLDITPTPDSLIRVLMVFKGLDEPIEVTPQQLTTPERTGFVAVEWGGTEIK